MSEEIRAPVRPATPQRRMVASAQGRQWTTFLAELLLIVAGILIALYIDGWMEDRRDRDAEAGYLALLAEDLSLIEGVLEDYVKFETAVARLGAEAYAAMSPGNLPADADALREMLAGLAARRTLSIVSAAYTELTSTGNLRLITNQDLRNSIVVHFATIETVERVVENNNSAYIDTLYFGFLLESGITPIVVPSTVPIVNASNDLVMELLGEDAAVPADEILMRPPGSRSWDQIRRQVLLRLRIAAIGSVVGSRIIEDTRQLREDIENELARRDQ